MFRLLYRSYATNCWRVSLGIVQNESLAEDAMQNAFMRAFQNLSSFKGRSTFKTWLMRILINESFKLINANKRFLYKENNEEVVENTPDLFRLSDELLALEKNELQQMLHKSLAKLSEHAQLMLNLFYLEEMSIKEIVQATSYSPANVKTSLYRARKELKAVINKSYNLV